MKEEITIWSEGTRLAADLFTPDKKSDDGGHPGILLCHGWAGPKTHLSATYAPFFCEAGFACLTFDYRGWFESDARLATPDAQPSTDKDGSITVRAYPVREVVDPLDQNRDIHNVLDYFLDCPQVNPSRLGLWGSSFGGGHVIFVAGTDPRIRAVVSQVPGMGAPTDNDGHPAVPADGQALGAAMAKGELWSVPRSPEMPESLKGAGDSRTLWRYLPRVAARTISAPTLILDQEDEEYGGRENSGQAAHEALPRSTTSHYHVFPGGHYDIYDKNYREAAAMARDWFLKHL